MSNIEVNKTGLNCVSNENGNVCGVKKIQANRQSQNNNEEFASEFDRGVTLEEVSTTNKSSEMFNNNIKSKPVSERTAWH